jgi:O-antigen/teichoic acid export membrane protein
MNRIWAFLQKLVPLGPFGRSVSILAGGTALSQALAVLLMPVLTRLYSAEDFGYFQIYLSFMFFAALTVTLRCEQAILLPDQEEASANLVVVTLCIVGGMSVLFGGAALLLHRSHRLPASAEGLRPYLWLVPLGIFGAGFYQTLSFWALRQKAYPRLAGTKVAQVIGQLGTQTIVGFLHSGPLGLLLGDVIGRTNGSVSLARLSWLHTRNAYLSVRWRTMWSVVVRYRRFPLVSSGSALVNAAGFVLPTFLIAQFYGPKILGWFALGGRVLGAPVMLIGQAVSQVYCVEAASSNVSDPKAMHALFLRSMKRLALLGVAPLVVFFFLSPVLFGFAFGQAWREAGTYARLLAVAHYLAFVSWPLAPTLNILEQQFWQLGWDVGRLVLTLGSLWLAYHWGSSARVAIGAFGAAECASYVALLLLSHLAIRKRMLQFKISGSSQITPSEECVEMGNV